MLAHVTRLLKIIVVFKTMNEGNLEQYQIEVKVFLNKMFFNEKIFHCCLGSSILYFKGEARTHRINFLLFVLVPKASKQPTKQTNKKKSLGKNM